jgi:hypothetical protein
VSYATVRFVFPLMTFLLVIPFPERLYRNSFLM